MQKIVFLFPGQGSQYVGMGENFYRDYPVVRDMFEEASDVLNMNLKDICFSGPESTLVQTENVQPAVTLINAACLQVLKQEGIVPSTAAGHSLGEYSALLAANVFDFQDIMKLVRYRGIFMKEAADRNPGGMAAVAGLGIEKIAAICDQVRDYGSVEIANHNSHVQIIITGEESALEKASELAKKNGAKLITHLNVSGPWHSKFMYTARTKMKDVLEGCTIKRPSIPVIANITADYESDPELIRTNLINQITCPVLWTSSMERFIRDGYTLFVEVGPKKVLKGLMRYIDKGVKIFNVEDSKTLQKFLNNIADYVGDKIS